MEPTVHGSLVCPEGWVRIRLNLQLYRHIFSMVPRNGNTEVTDFAHHRGYVYTLTE